MVVIGDGKPPEVASGSDAQLYIGRVVELHRGLMQFSGTVERYVPEGETRPKYRLAIKHKHSDRREDIQRDDEIRYRMFL